MREIRAVAFDMGNVLIDWIPEALVAPIAEATGLPGDRAMDCVFRLYARPKKRLDLGDLLPHELHAELNAIIVSEGGRPIPYDRLLDLWCATIRPRPGANELVRRLRPGLRVALWSNTDPIHFGRYSLWLPVLARFRSLWLSFLHGVGKPHRAYYDGALRDLDVEARHVLFFDDTPENVDGARKVGVDAVQAATLRDVEAELGRRGLLRDD